MATFGNTGNGANVQTQSADRKYAYKASPSTSGIVTGGTARVWLSAAGSSNAKLIIYSDNSGEPDALLAVSDEVAITNTSEQAINFTFSGVNRLSITASTQYWVGIHFSDPGTPNFTISRANTSSLVRSSLDTYSDGPSSTFTSTTTSNGPLDIYITYSEPTLSEGSTTTLEDFETIGDWTLGGDTGYDVVEDTTYKKSGSKSFKFTAPASGGAYVTRTINTDFLFVNTFSFWVYIPTETDLANFYSVSIYLTAQSDFSTYFIANPAEVYHLGWNKIILHKDDFTASGAANWAASMIRLRVRANADPTGVANVYVDKFEYNVRTAPKVVITFDDGWSSQYSVAYAYMDTLGLKGTAYIIAEKIDTAGYMTTANLATLHGDGWDLCTHGLTNLTTLTLLQAETDVLANRQFLIDEGLTGAYNHYAYPEGGYDTDIMDMLANNGFVSARTIVDRVQAEEIGEPHALTRRGVYDTTTLAVAQGYIDKLIKTGGVLLLNFHKIVTTPSVDTEWATADFEDLMDYIKTKTDASSLTVVGISDIILETTSVKDIIGGMGIIPFAR